MDPFYIERVIAIVGNSAASAVDKLTAIGIPLTASFLTLSIVMVGASVMQGGVALGSLLRLTGAGAGTLWVITEWDDIVRGTLNGARGAISLVIPGYNGPSALFGMATSLAGRIELEAIACSWASPSCIGYSVLAAVTGPIVWVGLAFTGLLATIAEFQLLIGAVAAPLVLPALAFPLTSQLGWGAVYFLVKAGVRVVVMGVTSWVMADALSQTISVTGSTDGLTSQAVYALVGLAVLTMMVGLYVNSIANDMVGGGAGSLGMGAARSTGGTIQSMGSYAGGAVKAGATIAAPAASAALQVANKAVTAVGRTGTSAFK